MSSEDKGQASRDQGQLGADAASTSRSALVLQTTLKCWMASASELPSQSQMLHAAVPLPALARCTFRSRLLRSCLRLFDFAFPLPLLDGAAECAVGAASTLAELFPGGPDAADVVDSARSLAAGPARTLLLARLGVAGLDGLLPRAGL